MRINNFRSAINYFLLEGEDRFELEQGNAKDHLTKKRIQFRETTLNELVFRIGYSHFIIQLIWKELSDHKDRKLEKQCAKVTLQESILEDAVERNLLEVSEVIENFYKELNSTIPSNFSCLFRKIGKSKLSILLKDVTLQEYVLARALLFPELNNDQLNVNNAAFANLGSKLKVKLERLETFRDKVMAHKYDPERFKINLTYQEYLEIIDDTVKILDAISIVGTLKRNDWKIEENFAKSDQIKNWIRQGLSDG